MMITGYGINLKTYRDKHYTINPECYDHAHCCSNGANCCKYPGSSVMFCCGFSNGCPNLNGDKCDGTWNVATKSTIVFMVVAVLAFFAKE